MNITRLFTSSLGKKFIMAGTGLALFLFVVLHLAGNLQVFLGPEAINRYGNFLQTNPEIIWPARIVLLVLRRAAHLVGDQAVGGEPGGAAAALRAQELVAASYASRTMLMSGLIILAFIIYHLLHFTVQVPADQPDRAGILRPLHDAKKRHDVYAMMVLGFSKPGGFGFLHHRRCFCCSCT